MEPPFKNLDGVIEVLSGYMGGHTENPTYEDVCSGTSGHTEVVRVTYEPDIVSYEKLLEVFWMNIDPTTIQGQFADIGSQYRPEIFYISDEQKTAAEKSKKELDESGRFDSPIVVEITPASKFYPAESYHQNYHETNPVHYKMYRRGSGREAFLEKLWGKS